MNTLKKLLIVLFKWIPLPRQLLPAFHSKHNMIYSLLLGTQLSHHMTCTHTHTHTHTHTQILIYQPQGNKNQLFKFLQGKKKNSCFLRTIINTRLLETPYVLPLLHKGQTRKFCSGSVGKFGWKLGSCVSGAERQECSV